MSSRYAPIWLLLAIAFAVGAALTFPGFPSLNSLFASSAAPPSPPPYTIQPKDNGWTITITGYSVVPLPVHVRPTDRVLIESQQSFNLAGSNGLAFGYLNMFHRGDFGWLVLLCGTGVFSPAWQARDGGCANQPIPESVNWSVSPTNANGTIVIYVTLNPPE